MKGNSTRYSHRESKLDWTLFTESLGDFLLASLHGEGPWRKRTSLSASDWTGSSGPPFRGGASALPGVPNYSSTWLRSRRITVSAPRRSSYKSYNIRGSRELEPRDPLSASQGTSSQRVVMERDGPKGSCRWDGLLDVITELKNLTSLLPSFICLFCSLSCSK